MGNSIKSLKKYNSVLGIPEQGVHKHYRFGFAIWDLIFTLLLAIFITKIMRKSNVNILYIFILLFFIGQCLHVLFGVNTEFIKFIKSIF